MQSYSDTDYFLAWQQILGRGAKSSTLKFAIARALTELVKKPSHEPQIISKYELSGKLLEYFWWQQFKFRLRQTTNHEGIPKIVTILTDIWHEPTVKNKLDLAEADVTNACNRIKKECFKEVIPKFHRVNGKRVKVTFYLSKSGQIEIPVATGRFISSYRQPLSQMVMLNWTLWLEHINSAPRIASKVMFDGNHKRKSLSAERNLLKQVQSDCFYCKQSLENEGKRQNPVDHFIPWSYLFDNPLWNCVLACQSCNRQKNNQLPKIDLLKRLLKRNEDVLASTLPIQTALEKSIQDFQGMTVENYQSKIEQLYQRAIDDGFVKDWSPVK